MKTIKLNLEALENVDVCSLVNMGATKLCYTDRHAYTVISAKGKTLQLQRDKAIRTDKNGMSESQSYRFERDPEGGIVVVTLRNNGKWIERGVPTKSGTPYAIGYRKEFYDYSF